jgi:hypothetical protein
MKAQHASRLLRRLGAGSHAARRAPPPRRRRALRRTSAEWRATGGCMMPAMRRTPFGARSARLRLGRAAAAQSGGRSAAPACRGRLAARRGADSDSYLPPPPCMPRPRGRLRPHPRTTASDASAASAPALRAETAVPFIRQHRGGRFGPSARRAQRKPQSESGRHPDDEVRWLSRVPLALSLACEQPELERGWAAPNRLVLWLILCLRRTLRCCRSVCSYVKANALWR